MIRGDTSWMTRGACITVDPDVFFPDRTSRRPDIDAEALAICAACPVRVSCLRYAIDGEEKHGIWGGSTEKDRRKFRRLRGWVSVRCGECRAIFRAPITGGSIEKLCSDECVTARVSRENAERYLSAIATECVACGNAIKNPIDDCCSAWCRRVKARTERNRRTDEILAGWHEEENA